LQKQKNSIPFRVFTYLQNSNYANARTYGIQSAVILYGQVHQSNSYNKRILCCRIGAAYAGTADTVAPSAPA
jgi:hypothetical protein